MMLGKTELGRNVVQQEGWETKDRTWLKTGVQVVIFSQIDSQGDNKCRMFIENGRQKI